MKICVAHPGLGFGGSEAVVMVLLDALQYDHELTLLTSEPFDLIRLNAAYETAVDARKISVALTPMPEAFRRPSWAAPIREALFARHLFRFSPQFDLHISGYNFLPFGVPAMQLVADFAWDKAFCREVDPLRPYPFNLRLAIREIYGRLTAALATTWNDRRVRARDFAVANSHWTANILASRHGISSRVIYPPVHSEPFEPSAPRTNDFVILGRVAPEKRVADAIAVLERVRARGHNINLHIIGPMPNSDYGVQVKKLAQQHANWVLLREGLYGAEKYAELARHGFALHMRNGEAFGIAVVEQIKMGMIPFVQDDGGPAEIVGEPRLCFRGQDQAVEVIDRILREPLSHEQLRAQLLKRGALFSAERFVSDMKAVIREVKDEGLL